MDKQIYRLSAICVFITALAFVLPRFVPNREGGFASAATAILVFLGLVILAAAVSLWLLVLTVRAYREISFLQKLAGIGPSVVLLTGVALLFGWLSY